ncbi:MAG: sigma-70 family RNA polymerase sigma factor [Deltaproteobacteria bacterium]|jgi:RNA polymerase sigma-70 factor (ECF subfamily)|nr:sigma-70 family RNA polymerase sigma factor [Deltaproteobacteria bacterium]
MTAAPPSPSRPASPGAPDALASPGRRFDPEFAALYRAEFDWVFRTLRRLGARDADLEDLAHDVMVVAYRAFDAYDRSRPIKPWLFGIAFRVVSDYRRRARFSREELSADERATTPAHQESDLERAHARALVLAALDALPLDQRAVFVAVELDETPVPELARALGIPLNTCYSRLRLGRKRFAEAVTSLHREDAGRTS